jgi:hypothetical protein
MAIANVNERKLGGFGTEIQVDETMLFFSEKAIEEGHRKTETMHLYC